MKDYEEDNFTENDVLACLETAGLKYKRGGRYILTQCPNPDHQDKNPSAQIYPDGWCNCHVCGRFHITKVFPELRQSVGARNNDRSRILRNDNTKEMKYTEYEQRDKWLAMPLIPRDHHFKGIPLEVLDGLGWRWLPLENSYYIPYFDATKHYIPFSQKRHLAGERRFSFLINAKPIAYGLWNLDNTKLFLVEGASDSAVLEYCGVPWIAMPSASSGALAIALAGFCDKNGIELIFSGDNDSAGLKLAEALDEAGFGYRVCQPPKEYKDWGEFFEATDAETIQDYCFNELFDEVQPEDDLSRIQAVYPDARLMNIIQDTEPIQQIVHGSETVLEIWQPKYDTESKEREAWLSCSKVKFSTPLIVIEFTKAKHLAGQRFCIERDNVLKYPVSTNGKIDVYRVPMSALNNYSVDSERENVRSTTSAESTILF